MEGITLPRHVFVIFLSFFTLVTGAGSIKEALGELQREQVLLQRTKLQEQTIVFDGHQYV